MKYVKVSKLEPGMILGREVVSPNGKKLLNERAELNKSYIDYLKKMKFEAICILEEKDLHRAEMTFDDRNLLKEEVTPEIKERFKFCMTDPVMYELYQATIENMIWVKWYE